MSIFNKVGGGVVGFFTGLFTGPSAALGKFFSIRQEENIGCDLNKYGGVRPAGLKRSETNSLGVMIIADPLFFIGGLFYGAIRGAILGAKEGCHKKSVNNIARELFTYDPSENLITEDIAHKIPKSERTLISYRTFYKAGFLNNSKRISPINVGKHTIPTKKEIAQASSLNPIEPTASDMSNNKRSRSFG